MKASWVDKLVTALSIVINLVINLVCMGVMVVVVLGRHLVYKVFKR
ncbi:hypothetical protein HX004_02750 [Myroides sp. 1354]|nr:MULTISPECIES: hypothetical protein [unclassified Myroides]MDM1043242.1 hypothetical protein [Myroides sp. R163-1]MDM1054705.1 hypothetical protein [Myroides sp. 1354]MDM1068002.1 hypothetical protein [Myroides sp. 1372]